MQQSDIIAKLTSCFDEFQSKLVSRIVCVDYIPLTYWYKNTELYCVVECEPGKDISVVFKPHFVSDVSINGVLRAKICKFNLIINRLRSARNSLQRVASSELTNTQVEEILAAVPIDEMNLSLSYLKSYTLQSDSFQMVLKELDVLIADLVDLKLSCSTNRDSFNNLNHNIEHLISVYSDLIEMPDSLEDLISFATRVYGAPVDIEAITEISEVAAKNIITSHLGDLKSAGTLNKHLFMANYELLHLFNGRFSRTHRFSVAKQRTFQALPEFVPIAMKFYNVPNPLLDVNEGSCMFDELGKRYRYVSNAELCTNYCSFKGAIVDRTGLCFSYEDPSTFSMSRIMYGLASDIDEAFCSQNLTIVPQVDPKVKTNSVVCSTDLAACLMYLTLIDASATIGYKTNEVFIFDKEDLKFYTGLQEQDNGTLSITACTPFSGMIADESTTRGFSTYIDSLLLRVAVNDYLSHPNVLDALRTEEQLKHSLFETQNQRRLNRIGVEL